LSPQADTARPAVFNPKDRIFLAAFSSHTKSDL